MKVLYEKGDRVWITYGLNSGVITKVNKKGVTVEDDMTGETLFISASKVEPTNDTLTKAKMIREVKDHE